MSIILFMEKVLKVNMDKLFPDVLSYDMNNLFLEINIYNKIVFLFGLVDSKDQHITMPDQIL